MKKSFAFWWIPAWLVFVVSLSIWWMIFSLRKVHQLAQYVEDEKLINEQHMLLAEGGVLVGSLLVGGLALIYYALRERRHLEEVKLFFSTFNHDVKTSLARLALQGERLTAGNDPKFKNFHKSLLDLERQLENSLHISQSENRELCYEKINLSHLLSRLHNMWSDIKFNLKGPNEIISDQTAIESILKNLISNSVTHGKADEILIQISKQDGRVHLIYSDNGKAEIAANLLEMGQKLQPSQKGTGLGLYLVNQWVKRLKGELQFSKQEAGLQLDITFPEGRLS